MGMPSTCTTKCGDGIVAGTEKCDDNNIMTGDGCDDQCAVEQGWQCQGNPSVCNPICGDGITAGNEECDDSNLVSLDGCSATCKVDVFDETEVNDTVAQANGPFTPDVLIRGSVKPGTDVDVFAIDVPATADLSIETFGRERARQLQQHRHRSDVPRAGWNDGSRRR